MRVKITIPTSESGYYSFKDLPELLATARYPKKSYPDRVIKKVFVWRDDGKPEGAYGAYTPPAGQPYENISTPECWSFELTTDLYLIKKLKEWRIKNLPGDTDQRINGDLVITIEHAQNWQIERAHFKAEKKNSLIKDAQRDPYTTGHLMVVDELENPIKNTHPIALNKGWVHIDTLQIWGVKENLEITSIHSVDQLAEGGATEQTTSSRDSYVRSRRTNEWTELINDAIAEARDPKGPQQVWDVFVTWQHEKRMKHGYELVDGEVKYNGSAEVKFLTLKSLRGRLRRNKHPPKSFNAL